MTIPASYIGNFQCTVLTGPRRRQGTHPASPLWWGMPLVTAIHQIKGCEVSPKLVNTCLRDLGERHLTLGHNTSRHASPTLCGHWRTCFRLNRPSMDDAEPWEDLAVVVAVG